MLFSFKKKRDEMWRTPGLHKPKTMFRPSLPPENLSTMSVKASPASAVSSPEERLRSRALDTLRTHALEIILDSPDPVRTVDVARLVAQRLELTLNEEEIGGLASVVRLVLDGDPLFSQSNRQWDLALRMGRAEGDRRKPVERAIEDFIDLIGRPITSEPLAVLAAAVYGRTPDYYERMIERVAPARKEFFVLPDETIAITRWLIEITDTDPELVAEDNRLEPAIIDALQKAAKGIKADRPVAYARSLVEKVGTPVDNRALTFVTWLKFPDMEPDQLFSDLMDETAVFPERGPVWVTAASRGEVLDAIRTLLSAPESAAEIVAAVAPGEETEAGILAPTTVRVSDEDLDQVFDYMIQDDSRGYRIGELCQQALEAFPGSRTYIGVYASLLQRMKEDGRFQWVGVERFRIASTVPQDVLTLPEGLSYDDAVYETEEGESDRQVDTDEWKPGLDDEIRNYWVQEVGDDVTTPAATPKSLTCSAPLHHYVAGTYYLRNRDRGFFPTEPDLVQVAVTPNDGPKFDLWINNRLGLVFGIKEWYDANLPWVGGKFTLERAEQADEYRLTNTGETEPEMDVPLEKLQALLQLRGEAEASSLRLSDVVERILKGQPEGLSFTNLFTQLNVVRRTRRAQLASALSGQRLFTQPSNGLWIFDEKRAAKPKGKKKGTPKRIREFDDDDDDDLEIE